MKRVQQGFTLIELMIVVAIVGILAAIALPAYQDYVVRSKMSEGEAAVAACKTSVSEFLSTKNAMPSSAAEAGCNETPTQFVASLSVNSGVITVLTRSTGANPDCSLILSPSGVTDATISTWQGTYGNSCAPKYVPSSFRG
jgi:type IV pilus assembly protein PilA